MKKKNLYGLLGIIPFAAIPVVAISCDNPFNRDRNQRNTNQGDDLKRLLLNGAQLEKIKNEFEFSLTKEGKKVSRSSKLMDVINELNKKYEKFSSDRKGDKIREDAEFKKYFLLDKPDISKISQSHRIDIKFKVNEMTRSVELYYDVICFDYQNYQEAKDEVVKLEGN
ncbi:hypothetical protein DA803_00965 [[Mycoplasma] phocae]|uniref:Variable surface lipoprotein n=1 Tax=[Mycoplasma] phocae TaxID=142651 RepID=A0A2Z5IQ63_9BACT|nr:variable surface lipoprotein [[Mycoplasma] phocae]AXE60662.1 hypothetical protein DA803_00965 [[Mycoplasma] phocae]